MTDTLPREWRAKAKLAADMRRHGPVRPARLTSPGAAHLAAQAQAAVEAARSATALAAREAAAHAVPTPVPVTATSPAKARPWYATGESKAGPKVFDMAAGKAVASTLKRWVRLAADLTDVEAADAAKGGASLQALIARYGIQASEWTTGTPS